MRDNSLCYVRAHIKLIIIKSIAVLFVSNPLTQIKYNDILNLLICLPNKLIRALLKWILKIIF